MHISSLRTVGGSVMLAIPKAVLASLNLSPNTKVDLSVDNGRLIVEPRTRPRYTLAELVAQCDPDAPFDATLDDWRTTPPEGREAL